MCRCSASWTEIVETAPLFIKIIFVTDALAGKSAKHGMSSDYAHRGVKFDTYMYIQNPRILFIGSIIHTDEYNVHMVK